MSIRKFGKCAQKACALLSVLAATLIFLGGPREAAAQSIPQFGLEWPGTGAVRRMLYWHNPFPIYDATYVFKVYPRKKTGQYTYYTTFFWCNDGTAAWDRNGLQNTYIGAHPYPIPAPHGAGQWELSINSNDYVTGVEVDWNRWYTQVVRVWRESPSITHHEFYYDWPNTSKKITQTLNDPDWAARNPPTPAIVVGQSPNVNGVSWGGYPGWEEFNGVISGIQMYSGLLSMADVAAEVSAPLSTNAGRNLIWYLNLNPRPSDVTDKKGIGTPHNPSWDGTTALEWSNGGTPPPPTVSNVRATNVTTSTATIQWSTSTAADSRVEYGTTTAYGQSTTTDPARVTAHSLSLSSLVAGTVYHYRVHSTDSSGGTASSGDFTFTTSSAADTAPPVISAIAATNVTTSGASIVWSTNEPADSQVDYGTTTNYGQSTGLDPTLMTAHSMSLTSLAAGTTYYYRVRSKDAAGNASTSSAFTFTTAAAADTTPPVISAVTATDLTAMSAVIRWTTNEAADSQINYGLTTSYGQTTPLDSARVTTHAVSLSGLTPSTTYHARARSRDAAGNLAVGSDVAFTTSPAGTPGAGPIAAYGLNEGAGNVTSDASGNGRNGTLVNGPLWTSGRSGNALTFDGLNDKVTLPSSVDISRLPFTFEAWIRPTNRDDYHAIFSKRAVNSASQMRFGVTLHIGDGRLFLTSQQTFILFWHVPPLNTWEHIAIVATSSGTQLYVNGIAWERGPVFNLGTRADAPVAIGNTPDDDDPFAGTIDDVRLYDRALTQSEIQTDMSTGL